MELITDSLKHNGENTNADRKFVSAAIKRPQSPIELVANFFPSAITLTTILWIFPANLVAVRLLPVPTANAILLVGARVRGLATKPPELRISQVERCDARLAMYERHSI